MQNKQYIHTNVLLYCSKKVSNNESEQRNFTHLIRCQAMKVNKEFYTFNQVSNNKSEAIHNIKHVKKA
jgi:hypothetical protein